MQPPFNTYNLPTVENICNQILREVIALPKVSMAHVTMAPGNVSLWHDHVEMNEVYFILKGTGILTYGNRALTATKGAYLVIPPNTPHKLKNTGNTDLEHLVFALPPFSPDDVRLIDEPNNLKEPIPEEYKQEKKPITALDGALIYELITESERKRLDLALAMGFLPAGRKAIPHFHKICEELYYVTSGHGSVKIDGQSYEIKKGSVIHIPLNAVHALENSNQTEELQILCVSSPAYREGDFIYS